MAGLEPFHRDALRVVVGFAHPCQVHRTDEHVEIDMLLKMVDETPAGSMIVVAADAEMPCALWGGLMSAGVQQRGAVGAVVDGPVRDLHQIVPLDFSVFGRSRSPLDIRGRGEMTTFGEPVVCRGVPVTPGDLVFADANGAVVVPYEAAVDVLTLCEDRITKEQLTEDELRQGLPAAEVYSRHEAF